MQIVNPVAETGSSNTPGPSNAQQIVISELDKLNTVGETVEVAGGTEAISNEVEGVVIFLTSREQLERIMSIIGNLMSPVDQLSSVSTNSFGNCRAGCLIDDPEQIHPFFTLAWQLAQALHKVTIF